MKDMFKKVGDTCEKFKGDISVMKDRIGQTFLLVADARYKVGYMLEGAILMILTKSCLGRDRESRSSLRCLS